MHPHFFILMVLRYCFEIDLIGISIKIMEVQHLKGQNSVWCFSSCVMRLYKFLWW